MSEQDTNLPLQHDVSEVELRHLYEEEEVERFLFLFSAYVTEVRLSASVANAGSARSRIIADNLHAPTGRPPIPHRSYSERVAYSYLLPLLPPTDTPAFTLKRLNLGVQRLYLALFPTYSALLLNLTQLALWKDHQRSLRYCIAFWFLWFHNLLLPVLFFRIVFGLIRHQCCLLTRPALKELQARREETAQAFRLGEEVQRRLSVTTLGPVELWRLFKLHRLEGRDKAKPSDAADTDEEEESFKRDMLQALYELADLHERIKNIFAWRHPAVSRRYLLLFVVVGLGTLVLPAKYVAKLVYCFGGILFWCVTPIVAALPRGDRIRLVSLLFGDAPTDADYAMELIAKRVAAGQEVDLASLGSQSRRTTQSSTSTATSMSTLQGNSHDVQSSEEDRINWKKWGGRVARGKALLAEGRQFLSTSETASRCHLGVDGEHVFLAEHASSPGLIALTSSALFFTPLTSTHARLAIPHDRMRGVRKSGVMNGISITWAPEGPADGGEREEKFRWVGNRDELFARLVGSDGGRWATV